MCLWLLGRGELCWPSGKRREKGELCLPLGKRRGKGGVVLAVGQEEEKGGSCICRQARGERSRELYLLGKGSWGELFAVEVMRGELGKVVDVRCWVELEIPVFSPE